MLSARALLGLGLLLAACAPVPTTEPSLAAPAPSSPASAPKPAAPLGIPGLRELERARLALHEGRVEDALVPLRLALSQLPRGEQDLRDEAGLLLSAVLQGSGESCEEELRAVRPCLARQLLLASALAFRKDGPRRAPRLAELQPADVRADDRSLQRLRAQWPAILPTIAVATLACGLADAATEPLDAGPQLLREAAVSALEWQALEERLRVGGLLDTPGEVAARRARAQAWVRGELPADEGLVDVFADDAGALLLLCLPGRDAQVLPLPPSSMLLERAAEVVESLRGESLAKLAAASSRLVTLLLPEAAREALAPLSRWTLILPDPFLGLPPTAWVLAPPAEGEPVRFLVEDHVLRLLPHVPGAPLAAAPAGGRWLDVSLPAVEPEGLNAVREDWTRRYGGTALTPVRIPALPDSQTLSGAEATVPALLAALPGCAGLRVSSPGAGADALGGLLFAPASGASGDEAAGLLSWARLAQLPLPPVVVCDGTRFDPSDAATGPRQAATALLSRASGVLLARWPEAPAARLVVLHAVTAQLAAGEPLDAALASALREWLAKARTSDVETPLHPRTWAALLPFVR